MKKSIPVLKATISLFLLIVLSQSCLAQQVIPLYKGLPPGNTGLPDNETFSRPEKGRPTVKNVTNPTLTVYLPSKEKQDAVHGAVIICPGGGYLNLSIEDGGHDVAKEFNKAGIAAFVLKYRTWRDSAYTDYSNIPYNDLQQAMNIIYSNARQWDIDTTKIGWVGLSAGGHLVSYSTNTVNGHKPAFTILVYPVISFMDSLTSPKTKTRNTLLGKSPSLQEKMDYSPELHVSSKTPPTFLVHAADDSTAWAGNSIAYYKALQANKIPSQLLIYQKGGHGFALYNKEQDEYWLPLVRKWMALNGFCR